MIPAEIAGALVLAVPALIAAWIVLRRQGMALFLFAAALIVVGVGYLTMTGATADIARGLLPGLVSTH
jgi:hypothetical protein